MVDTLGYRIGKRDGGKMDCKCGCGESVTKSPFKPGHDQKLRTRLERRVGGILAMQSLVVAAEDFKAGRITAQSLAQQVDTILS